MKSTKILLLSIFFLGLALRLFNLAKLPGILNRDEAALAYNALLIKESSQDEWQAKWPLTFKSFGDYKLPGYPYLLAALFSVLPANDFSTRLPSALAGSLLIIVAFFFAKDVLRVKNRSALLMSLLIAISPIFFFYSRIAFEANVALLLFICGLYSLLKEKESPILGAAFIFLAVLTYNTPLLLLPFLIPLLVYKIGWRNKKRWIKPIILLTIILGWAILNFYSLATQKSTITIFSDPSVWEEFAVYRTELTGVWQVILGNKYVFYGQVILKNILESFSLDFLVQNGGSHPWHSLTGYGHLFCVTYFLAIFMLIDMIGEIAIALFDKSFKKKHLILFYLLIISLAPSVVTVDSPHATRSLLFFFIFISLAVLFLDKLTKIFVKQSKLIFVTFLAILLVEGLFYYQKYFFKYPDSQEKILFASFKNLIVDSKEKYSDQPIAVIDEGGYQYILTAWYLKIPSQNFFATMRYQQADHINFYYGEKLLNYHFIKNLEDRSDEEKVVLSKDLGLIKYE